MDAHQRRIHSRQADRDFAWYWTSPEFEAEAEEARVSGEGTILRTAEDVLRFRARLKEQKAKAASAADPGDTWMKAPFTPEEQVVVNDGADPEPW